MNRDAVLSFEGLVTLANYQWARALQSWHPGCQRQHFWSASQNFLRAAAQARSRYEGTGAALGANNG